MSECTCERCLPNTNWRIRMIVCETCGNKRCPHATFHGNACTNSNEPGQPGSSYGGMKKPEALEKRLWVVGEWPANLSSWTFCGIFDTQEQAEARCTTANHFVGPCVLNGTIPKEQMVWPGAYFPLAERDDELDIPDESEAFGSDAILTKPGESLVQTVKAARAKKGSFEDVFGHLGTPEEVAAEWTRMKDALDAEPTAWRITRRIRRDTDQLCTYLFSDKVKAEVEYQGWLEIEGAEPVLTALIEAKKP